LMMVGMMFMMRGGNGQQHGRDTADHHDHDAPVEWQDTPTSTSAQPPKTTTLS